MKLITLKPVSIGKVQHAIGTTLDVTDDTAKWLISTGAAKAVVAAADDSKSAAATTKQKQI